MAQRPTVRISSSSRRPTVWCSRSQCQSEAGLPSWSTSKTRCPMGSWCQMSHGSFHRALYWLEPRGRSVHPRIEQLEPFATDCKLELHESGHVAARSRQTRDQAAADRIGDLDENNRHSAGYFLQGFRDREPKCFRGLEVDSQVELGRLLHGQVPPGNHVFPVLVHARQPVPRQEIDYPTDVDLVQRV